MRFSTTNVKYRGSRVEEIDARQNLELSQELSSRIVPRSPRGGGRGGGGGGGGKGSSSSGGSGGGGSSSGGASGGRGSRGGVSFGEGTGSRGSSGYTYGGGSRTTINSGVFAGRTVGGGTRDQVYGTSRYGSGYTYGGGGSYVAGRGFPHGYWPIYMPVGHGYYGHSEYGPADNSSRPGGGMQAALVRANNWPTVNERRSLVDRQANSNETASYYIVGDADTVSFIMQELVKGCSVVPTVGVPLNETNLKVHYEQAVQFYRSSSFMLALTSYNNSASLLSNAPANDSMEALPTSADTALPVGTVMSWLWCLNTTIGAAIPIMDSETPTFWNAATPAPLHASNGLNFVGLLWVLLWLLKLV